MEFTNKVVMITGAGKGIGKDIAEYFYNNGAMIAANVHNDTSCFRSWNKKRVFVHNFDVTKYYKLQSFTKFAIKKFGKIDILINNVGIDEPCSIQNISYQHLHKIMSTNFYSMVILTKYVCKFMIKAKYGKIINISSIAGKEGTINHIAYTSSKHAVLGFNKCLARELAKFNINVNAICPGLIQTDMLRSFFEKLSKQINKSQIVALKQILDKVPSGKVGLPIDVTRLVSFLSSDKSSNIIGQSINTDGGLLQW